VAVPPSEIAFNNAAAAERAGDLDRALLEYRRAASLDHPQAGAKAEQVRKQLVARYTASARSAFAKQDLNGAIRNWDRVIELDPANDNARLERQKSISLKERLEKLEKTK
jgi:tetratricopeptide (TPR) repeat protein